MAAENHPLLPTYVWGSQEPSACRQRLQHLGYFSLCRKAVFYTSTKQNKQTKKDEKDKKKPYLGSQTKRKLTHFGSLQCRYDLLCIKASTLFEKWIQIPITLPHFIQKNFRGWKQLPSARCTQWGQGACRRAWQLSEMCYQEQVLKCIWLIFWPVESPPGWCITLWRGNWAGKQEIPSIQAATSAEHLEFEQCSLIWAMLPAKEEHIISIRFSGLALWYLKLTFPYEKRISEN